MEKAYDPKQTDAKWYAFWEEGKYFEADAHSDKPAYSIVIPPPNVTGVLHMGHALVNTLQDILIRWKRMAGYETLWLPGTDHAGIATQTVVERHLIAKEGKRRKEYPRDVFLKHIWDWKEKSEITILDQLKRLGCSCDWSRLCFTMDARCNKAVKTLFKKLFESGFIYRGDYLVNWDPVTQTALADDEVECEERQSHLWHFKYHLADESEYIYIATTRPETILGDTAIAVAPKDERYSHLVGKKVRHPIFEREMPIITDHHVDPEFGTGAVKITPAHDPNDYRMGLDHDLEFINILNPDGTINENGGPFKGMQREEAREAIVDHLTKSGHFVKRDPHTLRVGVSYRSKAVIEPYLSKQWFVKMASFVDPLKEAVEKKKVNILPKTWENTYFHWVNNLRDWCISRQLWWGHRIPVWYRKDNPEKMLCYDGEGLPPEVEKEPDAWEQDPDVLDTWFSSSLWPLSTLGWPDKTADLKKFYPTNVLVTGHDILFFWVARMICVDEYLTDEVPFPETFLHGLIYGKSYWRNNPDGGIIYVAPEERREYDLGKPLPSDVYSKWEKLSKSKGNVIDPLEMIDEYGTDAVRMSLCACANQTPQIDLDRRRFEEFKNFANKVWNGARFVFMNLEDLTSAELSSGLDLSLLSLEDQWILSALNHVNQQINTHLSNYAFDEAANLAYNFFWKEFCATYVEISKPILFGKVGTPEKRKNTQKLLVIILCNMIRLLHPMAPFITEELFQLLKSQFGDLTREDVEPYTKITIEALLSPACVVAPYPEVIVEKDIHPEVEARFALIEEIIYSVRNIRGEMKIPPSVATDLYIIASDTSLAEDLTVIQALVKTDTIEIVKSPPELTIHATAMIGELTVMIPLPAELADKEHARLEKEREKLSLNIERTKKLLSNPNFLEKGKPELIEQQKKGLEQAIEELRSITHKLSQF